ncbi:MAG: hypothetical protein K1X72_27370 [Pyrinomonadaceae bacterium]|nr:hypothetical protein [Pyrinomonadaceae bacterium]
MKYTPYKKISSAEYSTLVETVKLSEQTRNFELGIEAFQGIWDDLTSDPDFSEFSLEKQAELFRIGGSFLSNFGKVKNFKNFQERGKNLLSKAIQIFEKIGENEKIADAQGALAICYFYEGSLENAEFILENTAKQFLGNQLNLFYLQNRVNLLLTKLFQKKYPECLSIINDVEISMEFCPDFRTCAIFHENAGLTYRGIGQITQAVNHYNKAIYYAEIINSKVFISSVKNNLAFLYNKINNFELAHSSINEAISIAETEQQFGWLASFYDTKAMIFANQGYFQLALDNIEKSIYIIKNGDDSRVLTEALWNKCKFLLSLERKEEAITLFGELLPIASQQMGEFAVKNFVKEFSEIIHIKQNGSLEEEVQRFKRIEIVNAIRQAKFNLYDAAEILKTAPNQLIKTIDKEFPELYQELDILQVPEFNGNSEIKNLKSAPRNISEISLKGTELFFENQKLDKCSTYFFSKTKMSEFFGISLDSIVAFKSFPTISDGDLVLVEDETTNIYSFGKVYFDKILNLHYFESNQEPIPLSFDEVNLIGKLIGYCPIEETENDKLFLNPLLMA